jgi:hypothetical protein
MVLGRALGRLTQPVEVTLQPPLRTRTQRTMERWPGSKVGVTPSVRWIFTKLYEKYNATAAERFSILRRQTRAFRGATCV